jgi:hypothetical protein
MPKAHIETKEGTKILIEGTVEEVANLIRQIKNDHSDIPAQDQHVSNSSRFEKSRSKQKTTPSNLIVSLIDGGFFKKPKDLVAIKVALEEQGHYYPVTTLSPTVLRFVRKHQLRRIKDDKRWVYVS